MESFIIGNPYIIKLIISPLIFLKGLALYIITFKPYRYYAASKFIKLSSLKSHIKIPDNIKLLYIFFFLDFSF